MTTIADCLTTLGVSLEALGSCLGLHEEFAVLKKAYFKSALAKHPDKGGDAAEFRKVHDAFEALRSLYDTGAVDCFATLASKCVGAQTPSDSSMPSWILNTAIIRNRAARTLNLSQALYTADLITKFGSYFERSRSRHFDSPMEEGLELSPADQPVPGSIEHNEMSQFRVELFNIKFGPNSCASVG